MNLRKGRNHAGRKVSLSHEKYVKIGVLMDMARHRPQDLFDELGVNLRRRGRKYIGCCPVHAGDSADSLNFFPDGKKNHAFWLCLSNHCERVFDGSILGFIQGVLSNRELGWKCDADTNLIFPRRQAIEWLRKFSGREWEDIEYDPFVAYRDLYTKGIEYFTESKPSSTFGICTRDKFRSYLNIPAQYYLERGYSPQILDKYDVGLCLHPASDLYGRVVVPIYADNNENVVGCIGRSVYPKCPKCSFYHKCNQSCTPYPKWRCSKGFSDKLYLYNYWNAESHIIDYDRTIIIVEGCGDVWRLEEAGIHNSVALNGADLTNSQRITIECSGATKIICLTDNDEVGETSYNNIVKTCRRITRSIRRLRPIGAKDVGELELTDPLFEYIKVLCNIKY